MGQHVTTRGLRIEDMEERTESDSIVSDTLKRIATEDELSSESSISEGDSSYIVESEDSTSSFSEDDVLLNFRHTSNKRKRPSRSSLTKQKSEDDEEIPKLSEYEKIRLKNIQERAALLASLGLSELKETMCSVRKPREKKLEDSNSSMNTSDGCENHLLVSCSSSNVSNDNDVKSTDSLCSQIGISTTKKPLTNGEDQLAESRNDCNGIVSKRSKQSVTQLEVKVTNTSSNQSEIEDSHEEQSVQSFLLDCTSMAACYYESEEDFQLCLAQLRSLQYDFKAPYRPVGESWFQQLSTMELEQKDVAKVVDGPICSIAVHPSPTCLMACAGDDSGSVAIWDVAAGECVDGIHRFTTHADVVNCLDFAPCHPEQLYTASCDGTVKCTNLFKATFDVVYTAESEQSLYYFDFLPPSSLCIAQSRGLVSIVDVRSPLSENLFQVCWDTIKTISVHPFRKEYFVTACDGGEVNVWDLRYMTTLVKPCTRLPQTKSATSAFFSPVTGNSILTSSKDCYQRLFDSSSMTSTLRLQAARKYYRAPAPTYFRPSWVPGRDDCFIISSSQYPVRIELISSKGKALHSFFSSAALTAPTNLAIFHPTQNILVGGSKNGSLCVFRQM